MNVTYKCNGGNAFISADGVQKMMASYEDVEELLIYENLKELIRYFYHRDKKELVYLAGRKDSLEKASIATGAYAVGSSIVASLISSSGILDNELTSGFSLGVLSCGALSILLNKYVFSRNKARLGLEECILYEEKKYDELNEKIEHIKKNSPVIKETLDEQLVDDRDAKKRLENVLNFVFYLGGNKDKVFKMYQEMTLHRFLREKMKITDLKTICEIESYVFYTFEDEIKKGNTYVKKGN